MGSKDVRRLKEEMISVYGNYCWLNDMWVPKKKDIMTFHHIIEKRNGGKAIWENGALLGCSSHNYLNMLDYNYHNIYEELNGLFHELNKTYAPPTESYYDEVQRVLRKVDYARK